MKPPQKSVTPTDVCTTDYNIGTSLLRTLWDLDLVLNIEVSSIQRSLNTLQHYTGTQNGVLIIEVFTFQRFVIERSHCIHTYVCSI